jgi:hypothetical protein
MLVKVGRQVIDTPFINPADSFMFPEADFRYWLRYNLLKNLELSAFHATEVKIRQSDTFDDAGQFVTSRLGVESTNNARITDFGAKWNQGTTKLQAWDYHFYDLFNMIYFQGDFKFAKMVGIQP